MTPRPIRPCTYPQCRDTNGNPALTNEGMCRPCQNRYLNLLKWLVEDWLTIHADMPSPVSRGTNIRSSSTKTYGHPAEWASDKAAEIANKLNNLHDALADHLKSEPAPHPGTTEKGRIAASWRYLRHRIPQLALYDETGDLTTELNDLHRNIRNSLGHTKHKEVLPVPCPNCELKTVTRTADPYNDHITCGNCGFNITEERYPFFVRMVLDALLDENSSTTRPTALA